MRPSPQISESSKRIKKDKKTPVAQKKESDEKNVSMAEDEEGMIVSDAECSQMSNGDSDLGVNPTEHKLIEKYEKYPEYIKVKFSKPEAYFEHLAPFNESNKHSISSILSARSKEAISVQAFPLSL